MYEIFAFFLGLSVSIILVVVALTLFFRLLTWASRTGVPESLRRYELRGVLDPRTPIAIHLLDGSVLKDVRLLGSLGDEVEKGAGVPYDLRAMLVVEHPDGRRTLIRAKNVKTIEMPPQA
ncbi:MAG: hypothetical protein BGO49_31390 [Planctomycetales bacterium 71-10]|nr:MAG: hypothetical protein BGO49_31390 [Planctomycetales bacterium 71-10]